MNKNLIVVDMQNDFIDGTLGSEDAEKIVANVAKEISDKKSEGYTVFATQDTHTPDYLNTLEGEKLPVEHCIEGTKGWEFADSLKPLLEDATIIEKPTFGSEKLVQILKDNPPDELEVIGLCTDICVVSNAMLLRAAFPNVPISVKKDCCAGTSQEAHDCALKTMQSCQIDIV